MAKKSQQEFVLHITPRSEDFSQWYTDVVRLADLMDYTPVRGCMAIKPYGYGIPRRRASAGSLSAARRWN